jgi:hypothetical protein
MSQPLTKYNMGDMIAFHYDREDPNKKEYVLIIDVVGTQYRLLSINHGDIITNDSVWVDKNQYINLVE